MTLAVSKKRKGRTVPTFMDDFFNVSPFFGSSLFDFNGGIMEDNFALIPDANIIENGKDYQIELAVPGLDRKDFEIEVKDDVLTVSAEKESENKSEDKNYRTREFSYSSFFRSFTLPKNLVLDTVDAKYHNGVLTITLPKKEVTVAKPVKKISVS